MGHLTDYSQLSERARRIRSDAIASIYAAGSGHPGGVLSSADLLSYIVTEVLRWDDNGATGSGINRFVLSKGHAGPGLYAAAADAGVIPRSLLGGLRRCGSPLQGHPCASAVPWVEASTGSLGQGFSFAIGLAMGLRHQGSDVRVVTMLGDGELQEGEVWEGAMCAAHHGLNRLCAVVDYNKMQSDDLNENIMGLEPLAGKWEAFNWRVIEIDGHDFGQIDAAFRAAGESRDKPVVIIAHTTKGKGVSFMEGIPQWHGSVCLREDELRAALSDLGVDESAIGGYVDGSAWAE